MSYDAIGEHARAQPDGVAILAPQGAVTWHALDEQLDLAATQLREAGADVRDVVAIDAAADLRTIIIIHAAWRLGICVAPLHPGLTETERNRAVEALEDFEPNPGDRGDASQTAAILWSSGSSGAPRGVALPMRAFTHNAMATAQRLDLRPTDRWLTTLSLAHVGGLTMIARAGHLGAGLVLSDGFSATDFHAVCAAGSVTHASLVPTMLSRLVETGLPAPRSLRTILLGGAAAAPSLVERAFQLGYPVALTYGMTETGSQIATASPEETRADPGSVGRPLDGVEVAIDEHGEILVQGPTLATHLVGEGGLRVDADGWLHTGDFGSLGADGALRVGGRLDARIITGGVNVDPLEVERALTLLPNVASACVVGSTDPEWGERVDAAVTLLDPTGAHPTVESVRTALRETLSAPKLPKRVRVLDALPVSRGGKVDRHAVLEMMNRSDTS